MRWFNEKNNLEFNFSGITFGDVFDYKTLTIDKKALITKVINRSPNAKMKDLEAIHNEVTKLEKVDDNLLQLCNGHDFMKLLALYISSISGKGVSSDTVAAHFRTSYTFKDFMNTNLFKDTKGWADGLSITLYNES
jgi:hypothetical protein